MADEDLPHPLRVCSKCGESKPQTPEHFYLDKRRQRLETVCKVCRLAKMAVTQAAARERRNELARERYADDPQRFRDKRKAYYSRYREREIEKTREWQAANPERARQLSRKSARAWRINNPEADAAHQKVKRAKRLATPQGRLDSRIRARLGNYMRHGKGSRSWTAKLGYTLDDLKAHIERQFLRGMGWHNMGEWHIDHIVPLSSFRYETTDDPEFRAAWALTNLRPAWAAENIRKGAARTHLL